MRVTSAGEDLDIETDEDINLIEMVKWAYVCKGNYNNVVFFLRKNAASYPLTTCLGILMFLVFSFGCMNC